MSLFELAPYILGEPVFEVESTPLYDSSNPRDYTHDVIYHGFVKCNGFDFLQTYPVVGVECDYTRALQEAIKNKDGFYYCLIKNGVIVSMQYVRDESQVRMVEG